MLNPPAMSRTGPADHLTDSPALTDSLERLREWVKRNGFPSDIRADVARVLADYDALRDAYRSTASSRATAFIDALAKTFRAAIREGGPNAKMHVGDVLRVIETYQAGAMPDEPEVTGPFYPPSEDGDRPQWDIVCLRSALENWGRHFDWCALRTSDGKQPCSCGYEKALAIGQYATTHPYD